MPRIAIADVPVKDAKVFDLDGTRVLICRAGTAFVAMDEICPHQNLTLDGARIRNGCLFCPHHGARFSLLDGRSMSSMTKNALRLYPVVVVGEEIEITLA